VQINFRGYFVKVFIITIHHIHNFGSVYQAYSLYRFLKDNGYDAEIIDYRPKYYINGRNKIKTFVGKTLYLSSYLKRKTKFEKFIIENIKTTNQKFYTLNQLENFYKNSKEVFIAGGDQLWNDYHPCGCDDAYKLCFTKSNKKFSYATSMGRDNYTETELINLADKIKDFNIITLRENSTVHLLERYSNVPVKHVIDPVGLLDVDFLKKSAIKPKITEKYAVMYLADSSEILNQSVQFLTEKMHLKIIHICGFKKKCYCDVFEKDVGPQEILGYILNADFVLSASFHATLFSILFNKQFATLLPGERTNARIEDILNYVNLSDRIIKNMKDINVLSKRIDFVPVNKVIDEFREKSRKTLINSLEELEKKL